MARHSWPPAVYIAIALIWCRPLLADFGNLVPSDLGDPLLSTWAVWWNAHVVPFTAEWWDGLAFYPARGMMTFSDHRVGAGLITSPLLWMGVSPLAAYNVAFVLSFVLSACAAYALGVVLTGNRLAGFIAGLVFGFHPFRAEHLSHLELLAAYWLPIILLALHRWSATRHAGWLVVVSVSLLMQALTGGYYFVYAAPLLGLWLLWFVSRLPVRQYLALAAALLLPLVVMAPVFMRYREVHHQLGLTRTLTEIEFFSADLRGLAAAPERLWFWNTPDAWSHPEGKLFPGLTAVLLITIAAIASRRTDAVPLSRRLRLVRRAVLAAIAVTVAASLFPLSGNPIEREIMGVRISITHAFKPLSIAFVLCLAWFVSSPRVVLRREAAFPFYVLATLAMWAFALGPTARLFGERVLWTAPYHWAMLLPGFADGFRVPARFAMIAALTLSAAAALAFARLTVARRAPPRAAIAAVVTAGILLDSWIVPLPVVAAPQAIVLPRDVPADAVVLELPMGLFEDATAMYRTIFHGRRTANGLSGYEPPHYPVLRHAVAEGRYEALPVLAGGRDLVIVVSLDPTTANREIAPVLISRLGARRLASTATHDVVLLPRASVIEPPLHGTPANARTFAASDNPGALGLMNDDNVATQWITSGPQQGYERFVADIGRSVEVTGLTLAHAYASGTFPRGLLVEVSADGERWHEAWRGDSTPLALRAAIARPRDMTMVVAFAATTARFVRVTQTGVANHPWTVTEFRVLTLRADVR